MANEANLKPYRSVSEARENGKKGGIASGKARRKKMTAQEMMKYLLHLPIDDGKPKEKFKSIRDIRGKNVTALMAGLANLTKDVAKGDQRAIELALRISGDYVEQVRQEVDQDNTIEIKIDYGDKGNADNDSGE